MKENRSDLLSLLVLGVGLVCKSPQREKPRESLNSPRITGTDIPVRWSGSTRVSPGQPGSVLSASLTSAARLVAEPEDVWTPNPGLCILHSLSFWTDFRVFTGSWCSYSADLPILTSVRALRLLLEAFHPEPLQRLTSPCVHGSDFMYSGHSWGLTCSPQPWTPADCDWSPWTAIVFQSWFIGFLCVLGSKQNTSGVCKWI